MTNEVTEEELRDRHEELTKIIELVLVHLDGHSSSYRSLQSKCIDEVRVVLRDVLNKQYEEMTDE